MLSSLHQRSLTPLYDLIRPCIYSSIEFEPYSTTVGFGFPWAKLNGDAPLKLLLSSDIPYLFCSYAPRDVRLVYRLRWEKQQSQVVVLSSLGPNSLGPNSCVTTTPGNDMDEQRSASLLQRYLNREAIIEPRTYVPWLEYQEIVGHCFVDVRQGLESECAGLPDCNVEILEGGNHRSPRHEDGDIFDQEISSSTYGWGHDI